MKTLFETMRPAENSRRKNRPQLVRTYVETGDPRCPLAGIWMQLDESGTVGDEPELHRPILGALLSGWAMFCRLPHFAIPTSR